VSRAPIAANLGIQMTNRQSEIGNWKSRYIGIAMMSCFSVLIHTVASARCSEAETNRKPFETVFNLQANATNAVLKRRRE
jgi:hypothetical protein